MKTSEAYPLLLDALHEVRAQWRRNKILEGILLAVAGAAVVVTALVAADNLAAPGPIGRWVLALLLWSGLAAALVGLVLRRVWEDRRDDFFAALVEQKHPELRNQLINALQLGRGDQRGFSPGLIAAIIHDAGKSAADMDMGDSVDRRPARRAAILALIALFIVAGYAAAFTPQFATGLARVLLPFTDQAPYTRSHIKSVDPGKPESRVIEGQDFPVEAVVDRGVPDSADLFRRAKGGDWRHDTVKAEDGAAGVFRWKGAPVLDSFDYYVAAGDARSEVFHVEAVKPPHVEKIALIYTYPAYLGLSDERIADSAGAVTATAGTTVTVELHASKPLLEAELRPEILKEGEPGTAIDRPIPMEKGTDDRTWVGSFVLSAPGAHLPAVTHGRVLIRPVAYRIHMVDDERTPNDSSATPITVVPDLPPRVLLSGPNEPPTADAVVALNLRATDDHGLAGVHLMFAVNGGEAQELAAPGRRFTDKHHDQDQWQYAWKLADSGVKAGQRVEYWAAAADHNDVTGPGVTKSRRLSFQVAEAEPKAADLLLNVDTLEDLLKRQRLNRKQTDDKAPFPDLVKEQDGIRQSSAQVARTMEDAQALAAPIARRLNDLAAGPMADAVHLLESGRDAADLAKQGEFRAQSLPVQDKTIAELEDLLAALKRLARNQQAREELKRIEKKDPEAYKKLTGVLADTIKHLDDLLKDETRIAGKFEKLPTKNPNDLKGEEGLKALQSLEDLAKRTQAWSKGSVGELPKLAEGFVDDFAVRKDANRIYEEVEKAAERAKSETIPVSAEDLGFMLGTKMKEDLESWLPNAPDNAKWLLEDSPDGKSPKIPEMPLPKSLEDMIGDLLQKADEFDKDADDVTNSFAGNLDQAGWGVSDGPMASFSAKGKTGNDLPNSNELNGRSGDGRRGKSTGQMVGDTSRSLPGRPTPARVDDSKFEPGRVKQEGHEDPNGATGGGKDSGEGRIGLQGDAPPPPEYVKDMQRLSAKQAGLREKAEKVAKKLDTTSVSATRLNESIELMKSVEKDLADGRYEDAARKRRDAMEKLRSALGDVDHGTAEAVHKAQNLPPELRGELLQSSEEAYPPGYEGLLKSYYKSLSAGDK